MGADGGVVYIPLSKPTTENYARVIELLSPFWQLLSRNGANWAEDANWEWEQNNSIGVPEYLLGYYGTDRGDYFDLTDLSELCEPTDDWRGYLHGLTFDELDLSCRSSPYPINGDHQNHSLERLWYNHFHYTPREEVLEKLGPIASMTGEAWSDELKSLLLLDHVYHEETWT